jgi:alkyl hydroperoxide reductase subunit AhpC
LKPREEGGLKPLRIPLLSDHNKNIARSYGVCVDNKDDDLNGVALRATFIIDGKGILRHASVNDSNVGRNVQEYIRLVQAFQYSDKHGEVCPSGWKPGKKAVCL